MHDAASKPSPWLAQNSRRLAISPALLFNREGGLASRDVWARPQEATMHRALSSAR